MSIIIMLILLSILILVHEAGHYLAARMFGIKVDKFGFGLPIGPTLWEKQCGDTKILVHAFLLGGYVAFPDDDKENPLPEDSPDRFFCGVYDISFNSVDKHLFCDNHCENFIAETNLPDSDQSVRKAV